MSPTDACRRCTVHDELALRVHRFLRARVKRDWHRGHASGDHPVRHVTPSATTWRYPLSPWGSAFDVDSLTRISVAGENLGDDFAVLHNHRLVTSSFRCRC